MLKNIISSFVLLLCINSLISCASPELTPEFIAKTEGRYLLNADEFIQVSYVEKELQLNWGGLKNIQPLQMNTTDFYIKEINQKIVFDLQDTPISIHVLKKSEQDSITHIYKKIPASYKFAYEYLESGDYDGALNAYLTIQKKDSLSPIINENDWNNKGYSQLRKDSIQKAILYFKLNVALHPNSYNVYDSLGEAYLKNGDSALALTNYKMAVKLNPSLGSAKRIVKKLQ
ncbi:MAG: tetratricopeptide repeat protein [Flavobacteriaceae bacterium]|nr:MAG: tetratricopeptide repeat protein [Flavobacteriaceae bacterium]